MRGGQTRELETLLGVTPELLLAARQLIRRIRELVDTILEEL
ncbi:MAG: hypothetical protein KatS3mg015_3171 [Fimbriimonadales bacterium]|jgi:hypothetical protein|nr:MAG: hypothetical protein KatS3mg015_3171 [Fimbriimonadales bacterium]